MPCDKKRYSFTRQELYDIQRALDSGDRTEEAAAIIQAVLDYGSLGDNTITEEELQEILSNDYA